MIKVHIIFFGHAPCKIAIGASHCKTFGLPLIKQNKTSTHHYICMCKILTNNISLLISFKHTYSQISGQLTNCS